MVFDWYFICTTALLRTQQTTEKQQTERTKRERAKGAQEMDHYGHPTHPHLERVEGSPFHDPSLVGAPAKPRLTREQLFHEMTVRDLLASLGVPPTGRDVIFLEGHNTVETALEVQRCVPSFIKTS